MEKITLGGGCFWCTEAIFRRLKGVTKVTSGYAGGKGENPTYSEVSTGETGFVESVQIEFDPKILSLDNLLDVFWATHDPTTLNRQGPDVGTQYKSMIFYQGEKQKEIAEKSKEKMDKSGELKGKIVTQILFLDKFYTAEEYHQNYYEKNKDTNSYCSLVIDPKIEKLINKFNNLVREEGAAMTSGACEDRR
ncbi:peptide-methionine (S)-S-oxide reductase MsrA [Candidatus Daviesbacteria bacterium]|nr:peptide-methionine (S)-S-oxide reductase MsrA [Candidatus Daviesbacteria bacterium]